MYGNQINLKPKNNSSLELILNLIRKFLKRDKLFNIVYIYKESKT